jgi:hypothetical protein
VIALKNEIQALKKEKRCSSGKIKLAVKILFILFPALQKEEVSVESYVVATVYPHL